MRYSISLGLASLLLSTAAHAEVPQVVTDIPPVHSLVAAVMGDLGKPALLVGQGGDAHDFQLRPSQAAALQSAGLVVWVGPEMTPWLDRAMASLGPDVPKLGLLVAEGTYRQDFGATGEHDHNEDHAEGADDDHDHAEHAEHAGGDEGHEGHDHANGHEGHDHSGLDPHAWLDPENGRVWLDLIAAELGRLDPANAATYAANAATAKAAVTSAEDQARALLEPVHERPLVVFHDAYGYFAGHFGLNVVGTITSGDAAAPGAGRLADLRTGLAGQSLCVFPEANHDARLSEQLASEAGLKLGGALDPEGSSLEPGPALYPALLTGLAGTLADCLGRD